MYVLIECRLIKAVAAKRLPKLFYSLPGIFETWRPAKSCWPEHNSIGLWRGSTKPLSAAHLALGNTWDLRHTVGVSLVCSATLGTTVGHSSLVGSTFCLRASLYFMPWFMIDWNYLRGQGSPNTGNHTPNCNNTSLEIKHKTHKEYSENKIRRLNFIHQSIL